jgi:hypothetical protein
MRIVAAGVAWSRACKGSIEAWRILIVRGRGREARRQFPGVPKPQPLTIGWLLERWTKQRKRRRSGARYESHAACRHPIVTEVSI